MINTSAENPAPIRQYSPDVMNQGVTMKARTTSANLHWSVERQSDPSSHAQQLPLSRRAERPLRVQQVWMERRPLHLPFSIQPGPLTWTGAPAPRTPNRPNENTTQLHPKRIVPARKFTICSTAILSIRVHEDTPLLHHAPNDPIVMVMRRAFVRVNERVTWITPGAPDVTHALSIFLAKFVIQDAATQPPVEHRRANRVPNLRF